MQAVALFLVTLPAICALKAEPSAPSSETLPIISLSLAPPAKSHPEVSSAIGVLDAKREIVEKDLFSLLDKAYNVSLAKAQGDLLHIVQKHMQTLKGASFRSHSMQHKPHHAAAFLEGKESPSDFEIKINVLGVEENSKDIVSEMELLNRKWTAGEKNMFQQACREFDWLTDIVKRELGSRLAEESKKLLRSSGRLASKATQFRGSSHATAWEATQADSSSGSSSISKVANVRVAPSDKKWPRISELIEDMRRRADRHHQQAQAKIVDLQLRFLQDENAIIKEALNSAVEGLAVSSEVSL